MFPVRRLLALATAAATLTSAACASRAGRTTQASGGEVDANRMLVVHEDTLTAGFGAEIAAVVAKDAFWWLDAPVERYCVEDVPMPYHPTLLDAVLPSVDGIVERVEAILRA